MIHKSKTPSGYEIVFEDGEANDQGIAKRRGYKINGQALPSVTTVLGVLDKPGLKFAAEKLAVKAAIDLANEGELPTSVDGALSRMKARDLRFYQIWNQKSDRGTVTHEDLVKLCLGEEPGEFDSFPSEQRGFIRGISDWFADEAPQMEDAEVLVASLEHGFAGRHDLFGVLPRRHPTGKVLLDLKTTEALPRWKSGDVKAPYPEHLLQLAGYELARRECGYEHSDYQAVLRVDSTGTWDLFCTIVDPDAFLAILGAYRALKGVPTKPTELKVAA